jgi:hypothetical protein
MKKKILMFALTAFSILSLKMNAYYVYYCFNGRVDIYQTKTVTNPTTGVSHTALVYVGSGGGCPVGQRWWFSTANLIKPTSPGWEQTELTPADYTAMSVITNNPPTQIGLNDATANFQAVLNNPTLERWIDPLKIDQTLANSMGLYNAFEIYAPTILGNPVANKKVDYKLRSNTGRNITVKLTNSLTGAVVYNQSTTMIKGENSNSFTVASNVSGTFVLSFISLKNTINRTIIIN